MGSAYEGMGRRAEERVGVEEERITVSEDMRSACERIVSAWKRAVSGRRARGWRQQGRKRVDEVGRRKRKEWACKREQGERASVRGGKSA